MEKAASNPVLAGKLEALEQRTLCRLFHWPWREGIDLVPEDFVESAIPLNDEQTRSCGWWIQCNSSDKTHMNETIFRKSLEASPPPTNWMII